MDVTMNIVMNGIRPSRGAAMRWNVSGWPSNA